LEDGGFEVFESIVEVVGNSGRGIRDECTQDLASNVAYDSDFESVEKLICRIRMKILALYLQANSATARKVDFACENLNAMFETDPK
jgi:hypothetical protein